MPPSIPFLRLTPVPQLLILEYLSLFQLFHFSLLSKKTNQIAKSCKRNIKELNWEANYADATFTLNLTDYESNVFGIPGEITFEGRQLTMREEESEKKLSIGVVAELDEERTELFEKLTEHFLAMLNVENYSLWMENTADLTTFFLWKYTKNFEKLSVQSYDADDELTARDMEFIFEELTVTGKLEIDSRVAEGFQWTEPLNTEHIVLRDCHFLSLDVYLNSKVEKWYIDCETFPTTYLNAIMKKWLDGGLERLKSFEVEIIEWTNDTEHRLTEALEGIQTFSWDRRTRKKMWSWSGSVIDTSKGRDIRRSDGKLATVGAFYNQFYFIVWDSDQLHSELDSSDEDSEEDVDENED